MTPRIQQSLGRGWALAALGVLVAACGGATPSATPVPAAPTTAPTTATPTAGASIAVTAAPPTSAPATRTPGSGNAAVALTFTGTRVFTANGTNGVCRLVTVDGSTKFGFEASKDDYPAFGESFSVGELDTLSIKWVIDSNIAYANDPNVVIQISADHHTVTLDQDLEPLSSGGGPLPGPQHVKGTISCSS